MLFCGLKNELESVNFTLGVHSVQPLGLRQGVALIQFPNSILIFLHLICDALKSAESINLQKFINFYL